jgi:hypothetical protein
MELRHLEKGRKEQFDEQSVTKVVHTELDLISVFSQTRWRSFSYTQNSGIAKEQVQQIGCRYHYSSSLFNRGKRCEITPNQVTSTFGAGLLISAIADSAAFGLRAAM